MLYILVVSHKNSFPSGDILLAITGISAVIKCLELIQKEKAVLDFMIINGCLHDSLVDC